MQRREAETEGDGTACVKALELGKVGAMEGSGLSQWELAPSEGLPPRRRLGQVAQESLSCVG